MMIGRIQKKLKINRKNLLKKLEFLRLRIEVWCTKNGYDKMDNYTERLDKGGNVVWKVSDWEFVDNMHNTIYNDREFGYNGDTLKKLNRMWNRYRPYDESSFQDFEVSESWNFNEEYTISNK
jgi:hypothetical protein